MSEPEVVSTLEVVLEDPLQLFTEEEYRQFVSSAALELMKDVFSDATWRACWLSVVEGRKAADIAQKLGISENAVYLSRGRVLKRLRAELAGLWD